MGLTPSPVCASCQLVEEMSLHLVYVCPILATLRTRNFGKPIMNASEFTEVSASAILRFAFQSGRLETNIWHNSHKCVRRLLIYDSSINVLFVFTLFTFHIGEHIGPKQRTACRSSTASIRSGSTLLNPSICWYYMASPNHSILRSYIKWRFCCCCCLLIKAKQKHGKNENKNTDLFINCMDFVVVGTKINKK
jgi:hypothetical protein